MQDPIEAVQQRLRVLQSTAAVFLCSEVASADVPSALVAYQRFKGWETEIRRQHNVAKQLLKEVVDMMELGDLDPPADIVAALKAGHDDAGYATRTAEYLANTVDPLDLRLVALLLLDPKFFDIQKVVARLSSDEDTLLHLTDLTHSNRKVFLYLYRCNESVEVRVRLFRHLMTPIIGISDPEMRSKTRGEWWYVPRFVGNDLLTRNGQQEGLLLIEDGFLSADDVVSAAHAIPDDQTLHALLSYCDSAEQIGRIAKCITDPSYLQTVLANETASLSRLAQEDREDAIIFLQLLRDALAQEPQARTVARLRADVMNKFVLGIWNGCFMIAWSNTNSCAYHREIFERLGLNPHAQHQQILGSGGMVEIKPKKSGGHIVTFDGSSGDFGCYGQRLLQKFVPQIRAELVRELKTEEIEVIIKPSH